MTGIHEQAVAPAEADLSPDDLLRAAQDLVPMLRDRAAETDRQRRIGDDVYRALHDAGLFRILKPRRYGGLELSEYEHARVTLTLATGCPSTAWVYSILAGDSFLFLMYSDEVLDEIWGEVPGATLAGNINCNQDAKVERVAGGYRLSGAWPYCSGSDFAEWLIFAAPAPENGDVLLFLVPREEASTIDDWHPTGMRGTGSRTKVVDDVLVPEPRVKRAADFQVFSEERRASHPSFDLLYSPLPPVGLFEFAGVAVGAAMGVVDHFSATAGSSVRVANLFGGSYRLADDDYVAGEFAEASGDVGMAAHTVHRVSAAAADRARRRVPATALEVASGLRDHAHVTRTALRSVNRIYSLIGAKTGDPSHPVTRAKRDIEMISHHVTLNWRQAAVGYLAAATSRPS